MITETVEKLTVVLRVCEVCQPQNLDFACTFELLTSFLDHAVQSIQAMTFSDRG